MCQPFTTTTFAKRPFRCSAPAVWNSLPKSVLNNDSVAIFTSRLKTFLFSRLSLLPLLTNALPGSSASEITTLWRYTNMLIIVIVIISIGIKISDLEWPWTALYPSVGGARKITESPRVAIMIMICATLWLADWHTQTALPVVLLAQPCSWGKTFDNIFCLS